MGHKRKGVKGGRGTDRRGFMVAIAGWGAAGLGGLNATCSPSGKLEKPALRENGESRVVRLDRPEALGETGQVSRDVASSLLGDLLKNLRSGEDAVGMLASLFRPGERVGIKLNCLAGRKLSPTPELVFALTDMLEEAGIEPSDIIIFERTERELRKAGFSINRKSGVRVLGNDSYRNGYDMSPICHGSIGSCFSRILTQEIDGLINLGVMKDHDLAGVSIGLKNLYGLIHNPNKYHDNNCSPYVAHVAAAPPVRNKLRLTICDGLTAQYMGGPAFNPSYTWKAGILLASRDPVALDAVGADIIEEKRRIEGKPSLAESGQSPFYLEEARKSGLGENRLEGIKVLKI